MNGAFRIVSGEGKGFSDGDADEKVAVVVAGKKERTDEDRRREGRRPRAGVERSSRGLISLIDEERTLVRAQNNDSTRNWRG